MAAGPRSRRVLITDLPRLRGHALWIRSSAQKNPRTITMRGSMLYARSADEDLLPDRRLLEPNDLLGQLARPGIRHLDEGHWVRRRDQRLGLTVDDLGHAPGGRLEHR